MPSFEIQRSIRVETVSAEGSRVNGRWRCGGAAKGQSKRGLREYASCVKFLITKLICVVLVSLAREECEALRQ